MEAFQTRVTGLVEAALQSLDPDALKRLPQSVTELIEIPPNEKMGDYAFPCFALARAFRRSPAQIAEQLADAIEPPEWLAQHEAVAGYLNFYIQRDAFANEILTQIDAEGDAYGSAPANGETVVIDYSSPNIAKPFTLGHIRSTVIGESLARIFAFRGFRTVRINHLGDWGTQFGRLMVGYRLWGDDEALQREPIKELFRIYVRFHEEVEADPSLEDEGRAWFKRLEDGDEEPRRLWDRFRSLSLFEFNRMYERLGIRFDDFTGESAYTDASGNLRSVLHNLKESGLLTVSEGAEVVELEDEKLPPCLIRKSDGATLYATRDIAAALRRQQEYGFRWMLYVVDSRQSLHFKQVFAVLRKLGYSWADGMEHIAFGTLQFGDEIMSTRKGNVIFLEDVLNEAVARVRAIIEERNPDLDDKAEVAEAVGIGAVVFNDLSHNRVKDISFSWESVLSFDGDTGPYVQYTHARACSVLRKAEREGSGTPATDFQDLGWEDAEMSLLRLLARFPAAVAAAAAAREPSTVARYVLDLAKGFNAFYHGNRILGVDRTPNRLALTDATRQVLANGLHLLGLAAPPSM